MKAILPVLILFVSNLSLASTIQVERPWKEVVCMRLAQIYNVKLFDLEYCIDNSAVSTGNVNHRNQMVRFNFKGYPHANSVMENCDGAFLLDESGHFVRIFDVVCKH